MPHGEILHRFPLATAGVKNLDAPAPDHHHATVPRGAHRNRRPPHVAAYVAIEVNAEARIPEEARSRARDAA